MSQKHDDPGSNPGLGTRNFAEIMKSPHCSGIATGKAECSFTIWMWQTLAGHMPRARTNVIRRREETAATRSLLNTARVMEDNPIALRLKELETLEKVTEKIDKISVFGGLDAVLKDLVKIRA